LVGKSEEEYFRQNRKDNKAFLGTLLKSAANGLISLTNVGNQIACAVNTSCAVPTQYSEFTPSSSSEAKTMRNLSFAMLFIPGDVEEAGASKATYLYARFTVHHHICRCAPNRRRDWMIVGNGVLLEHAVRRVSRPHRDMSPHLFVAAFQTAREIGTCNPDFALVRSMP
jgi:hypothetical protein